MRISPPVAIAVIVVVLIVAALFVWKGTSVGRYPPPPPIQSGLPQGAAPTRPPGAPAGGTGQPIGPGTMLPRPGTPPAGR